MPNVTIVSIGVMQFMTRGLPRQVAPTVTISQIHSSRGYTLTQVPLAIHASPQP